ncbi:MAG: BREX system P-loop protein BrxC [Desulfobacterales bacterium]|nr:BREX system P-loop protein BrxC [Desulfobacterales bacterium]
MTTIKELLSRDIEENIAPVVYFHRQGPRDVADEVREYVITTRPGVGGESGGGIHEQYVSLLTQIAAALENGECSLPASWISGYYGSGKSSFAKLLGLSMDGATLPDGRPLSEALLDRDDTPHAPEFRRAWEKLTAMVDPLAVVFDIGALARGDEMIHKTVHREVQKRLGYSSNDKIAYFEKLLEEEGRREEFLRLCESEYGISWDELKDKRIASQRFSLLYSTLFPVEYPDPMDWLDAHVEDASSMDARSVQEAVESIGALMERRAPGKTLFIVIDEVSQYIGMDQRKMLDAQSFVSELGARLEGRVWLFVTGQEKLGDVGRESVIWKMRDRFPTRFRVHLDRANVREIVHRRLLAKDPRKLKPLEEKMDAPGAMSQLKLSGFECEEITRDALIAHYPLLPGHIDLLLNISQGIRNSSTRIQADSGSVRGVLQIIWDLFNHKIVNLKNGEVGALVTLDLVYDILRSSLNSDTLLTMDRIAEKSRDDPFRFRVAKAVALLEVIQETLPTTAAFIARVLYPALGAEPPRDEVDAALRSLEAGRFIVEQETLGWRIQDHSGQDWIRRRDRIAVAPDKISELVYEHIKELLAVLPRPRLDGAPLPWEGWRGPNEKIGGRVDYPAAALDVRYVAGQKERNDNDYWVNLSKESVYKDKFIWVCGDHNDLHNTARRCLRSRAMIEKNEKTRLSRLQERLLVEEKAHRDRLLKEIPGAVRGCWLNGRIYFNGAAYKARDRGNSFEAAVKSVVEENLSAVYPNFKEGNFILTRDKDLAELFNPEITSPNPKFMENGGLGLLAMDAGRITFTAAGPIPTKIKEYLAIRRVISGQRLARHFGRPPHGRPRQVIKACLIALLRCEAILVRDGSGARIGSYKDPGAKDVFLRETGFNRCEIIQNKDPEITPRIKVACARFFRENLGKEVRTENDVLADAVFDYFVPLQKKVGDRKIKLKDLSLRIPARLEEFSEALRLCCKDRRVQSTVTALRANLETLKEGLSLVNEMEESLTETAEAALKRFREIRDRQLPRLHEVGVRDEIRAEEEIIDRQLASGTPWRGYADVLPAAGRIEALHREKRVYLLQEQDAFYDAALDELKGRPDFSRLTSEQAALVIRHMEKALVETTPDDSEPALIVLKRAEQNIRTAAARANDMIDEFIQEVDPGPIQKVSLGMLRNRTFETDGDLDNALNEFRDVCLEELREGKKVRLVY